MNSLLRIILLWAVLSAVFSESAFSQGTLPGFDGFSYAIQGAEPGGNGTRPEVPQAPLLSEQEGFELQLALDKAISQILKLTVDYEALRSRVQTIDGLTIKRETPEQNKTDELRELNARKLQERDKQLAALIIRLDALQIQYDQEKGSRLQTESKLRTVQNKNQTIEASVSESSARSDLTAGQLQSSQLLLKELELEIGTANEVIENLLAERQQLEASTSIAQLEASQAAAQLEVLQAIAQGEASQPIAQLEVPQAIAQNKVPSRFSASNEWVIEGLEFDQGSAIIEQHSIQTLDALLTHLKQNPKLSIQVNGYTDSIGSTSSNVRLSQQRADAVANYLITQGIEASRVNTLGYGERRPLGDNALEQGRLLNRRVAVLFLN